MRACVWLCVNVFMCMSRWESHHQTSVVTPRGASGKKFQSKYRRGAKVGSNPRGIACSLSQNGKQGEFLVLGRCPLLQQYSCAPYGWIIEQTTRMMTKTMWKVRTLGEASLTAKKVCHIGENVLDRPTNSEEMRTHRLWVLTARPTIARYCVSIYLVTNLLLSEVP